MLEDARIYHGATWRLPNLPTDSSQLSGAASVNKQDIEKYLRMLGQELQQRQITGEILLAGGAVMLLVVQNREVTKDIDAYFKPEQANVIREAARAVADREGLADDLSSSFCQITPGETVYGNSSISLAQTDYCRNL
jgi:hypothetical protein